MKKFGNVLWGLVLIVVGGIFGLNALGITDINIFFDGWWTLFIIIPCFIGLITDNEKTGSIIGLIIGIALLLACQDYINFELVWKLALPAILVIIGVSLIFKDTINSKVNSEIKRINKESKDKGEYTATFSAQDVRFNNEEFNGAELTAVFGGVKCDLRGAIINKDVVINAEAVFGGVEIFVPNDVKIKVKSTPVFGGVSNKAIQSTNDDSKIIYVNATSVFGGVEIK